MAVENFYLFELLIKGNTEESLILLLDEYKSKRLNHKSFYRIEKKLKAKDYNEEDAMFCFSELINAGYCINYYNEESRNLRRTRGKFTPLNFSIVSNVPIFVDYFLKNGANVNELDMFGCTPIFFSHSEQLAEILIENGADLEHRNNDGHSVEESLTYMNNQQPKLFDFTPALNFILEYKKKQLAGKAPVDLQPSKKGRLGDRL